MDRKAFGIFSSWQATLIVMTAIIAPSALYAIPSFTNVAIEDPNTGARALVDAARRLYTYDPIAGLANSPGNYFRLYVPASSQCTAAYTVPSGKALVLKSVTTVLNLADPSKIAVSIILTGTPSAPCSAYVAAAQTAQRTETISQTLGQGVVIQSGHVLAVSQNTYGTASAFLYGYFVPSGAPQAAAAGEPASTEGP